MIRTIAITAGAAACALGGWLCQSTKLPQAAPTPVSVQSVAISPAAAKSHRERVARLVAETAATTADRTAKAVLARRSAPQETAAR
ncbi:MAG: hypothetical protein NVS9B10_23780 [Nevskia sp.]